jgi:hypothetical protein
MRRVPTAVRLVRSDTAASRTALLPALSFSVDMLTIDDLAEHLQTHASHGKAKPQRSADAEDAAFLEARPSWRDEGSLQRAAIGSTLADLGDMHEFDMLIDTSVDDDDEDEDRAPVAPMTTIPEEAHDAADEARRSVRFADEDDERTCDTEEVER